jgi:hypothetical protein
LVVLGKPWPHPQAFPCSLKPDLVQALSHGRLGQDTLWQEGILVSSWGDSPGASPGCPTPRQQNQARPNAQAASPSSESKNTVGEGKEGCPVELNLCIPRSEPQFPHPKLGPAGLTLQALYLKLRKDCKFQSGKAREEAGCPELGGTACFVSLFCPYLSYDLGAGLPSL